MDVTQSSADVLTIRGFIPSSDLLSSNETVIELSTESCNLQASCTATIAAPNGPVCNLYPLDMAFAGDAVGLITDRQAQLHSLYTLAATTLQATAAGLGHRASTCSFCGSEYPLSKDSGLMWRFKSQILEVPASKAMSHVKESFAKSGS